MSDQPERIHTTERAAEDSGMETTRKNGKVPERHSGRSQHGPDMNESYIQAVLDIEKQADDIYTKAVKEADHLPEQAEAEAHEFLERSRLQAQEEARKISSQSRAQEESDRVRSEAEENVRRMKTSAASRMDMAANFILDQVAGKE